MVEREDAYGRGPCYVELMAIVLAGALHVVVELGLSATAAHVYNVAISGAFLAYLGWRAWRTEGVFRIWGMRRDNFWTALGWQLAFAVPPGAALVALGVVIERVPLPGTFWLILGLYPVWGVAQQFALQNLLARNLTELVPHPVTRAAVAAVLFSGSHFPRYPLMAMTVAVGFVFTLIYQRHENLWAVGCVHGLLGALAFYIVLGEDPGAQILEFLVGVNR